MPTFTLIISDDPFTRDSIGEAPFLETIEQGASNSITTPATEAYKRCLNVIASPAEVQTPSESDLNAIVLDNELRFNKLYDASAQLIECISDEIMAVLHILEGENAPNIAHHICSVLKKNDQRHNKSKASNLRKRKRANDRTRTALAAVSKSLLAIRQQAFLY